MPGDREQDDKVASPVTACSSFVLIALSLSRISCASLLPGGCVCRTQVQVEGVYLPWHAASWVAFTVTVVLRA